MSGIVPTSLKIIDETRENDHFWSLIDHFCSSQDWYDWRMKRLMLPKKFWTKVRSVSWVDRLVGLGRLSTKSTILWELNWPKLVQAHDMTVVHKITHWLSAQAHFKYWHIYLMDITGNLVQNFGYAMGWIGSLGWWIRLGQVMRNGPMVNSD